MADPNLQKFTDNMTDYGRFSPVYLYYFFADIADPRVDDWLFMKNSYTVIGIIILYLLAIYVFLPRYMKNKKPYELKTFIQCYNIFQVISCAILAHGVITSGWSTTYTLGCQPVVFSRDKLAMQLASYVWWNMIIKGFELIETLIFALRKKNKQISVLHVFHHVSTFMIGWMSCKYAANGSPTFTIILNSLVHVLMYSYYFLASLGPEMQARLTFFKSKITIIQMTQLIIIFLHTFQLLAPSCDIHIIYPIIYLPILTLNILLFLNFYRKNYLKNKRE